MHRTAVTILVATAASLVASLAVASTAGDDQFAVAAGHYGLERWKLAAAEFRTFLIEYPDHPQAGSAEFYLAESLVQTHEFSEAAEYYERFLAAEPDSPLAVKALFRAGEANYLAHRWEEAWQSLNRFRQRHPDDPLGGVVLWYLGDTAMRRDEPEQAEKLFTELLERYPKHSMRSEARLGIGRALAAQHRIEAALEHYSDLAREARDPLSDAAQFQIGAAHFDAGAYEAAADAFAVFDVKYLDSPWRDWARLRQGQSLYHLARYPAAEGCFISLAESTSVAVEASYWQGLTLKARGRPDAAADLFTATAASAAESDLVAALLLYAGEAFLDAGRPRDAFERFQQAAEALGHEPYDEQIALGQIRAYLKLKDHDAVDRETERFAARFPGSSARRDVIRLQARSLLDRDRPDDAIALIESMSGQPTPADGVDSVAHSREEQQVGDRLLVAMAHQIAGRHAEALAELTSLDDKRLTRDERRSVAEALGISWLALERFDEALATLAIVVELSSPEDLSRETLGRLAVCHARAGKPADARRWYQEFAAAEPSESLLVSTTIAAAEAALATGQDRWAAALYESFECDDFSPDARAQGLAGTAWIAYRAGRPELAMARYRRLLARYPKSPPAAEAALVCGRICEQLGRVDAALAMYQKVMDRYAARDELPQAMLAAARLHDAHGHVGEAIELYSRLVDEFPKWRADVTWYEGAWVLRGLERNDEADAWFEHVRSEHRSSSLWADAVYRLAERAFATKQKERARRLLAELISASPDEAILSHALFLSAQLAVADEDWVAVKPPLEQLIERFPDNALRLAAEYWIAESYFRRGDYEPAGTRLDDLARRAAGSGERWAAMAILRRAQVQAHGDRWAEALASAETLADRFPDFALAYEADYVVGRSLASLGQFEAAREAYHRVIRSEAGRGTETAAMAQWMIGETLFHQEDYTAALREYLKVEILYAYPEWQAAGVLQAGKCHEQLGEITEAAALYQRLIEHYADTDYLTQAEARWAAIATPSNVLRR